MGKMILKNAYVSVNGVTLSDHADQVTITYAGKEVDSTAMGDMAESYLPGLTNWTADVSFLQDFAAASVDATLFPLVGAAAFPIEIRADAGVRSVTNPGFSGNAIVTSYPPIAGKVGDKLSSQVKFRGTGVLSRLTA